MNRRHNPSERDLPSHADCQQFRFHVDEGASQRAVIGICSVLQVAVATTSITAAPIYAGGRRLPGRAQPRNEWSWVEVVGGLGHAKWLFGAVANKVQTLDGRWLSIDGRVLFKANVAASETYNTALEQHLRESLGVRFAERPGTEPGKRPIREIVGVDPRLNQRWSTRRAHINTRRGELAIQFQHDHGRPPTPVEALHLAQQATLEIRDPNTNHDPWPSNAQPGSTRQQTCWAARNPLPQWSGRR